MNDEALFHEALAKPPAERAAFLEQACVGQPELRAAVEALLAGHEASGSMLDRPAMLPMEGTSALTPRAEDASPQFATTAYQPALEAGTVIAGRYTLVQRIGGGGMGEVWVAKQTEPVKRKVAVKLIKAGMDSRAVLTRFEQERQALALMDHPNIAKVLDGGLTHDQRPFFVMELVNGLPLNKFCDNARLTPRQRLELFVPICQAVQHAHQKAIVHRDLKPSNILVTLYDGKPVPKVIDFGVAKAIGGKLTDDSVATQFGAVIGTFEYMAPEQAGFGAIDIDTRADVYSLGVVLYELLTGLRPLDAKRLRQAALTEMVQMIQQEEPSKPSTRLSTDESLPSLAALRQTEPKRLMAMLRGVLDWVVMKCLEKERGRRYETASGLARDIERYLADEPVEARPPSAGYRMSKFLRRHKRAVLAAGALVLALIAGVIGTTWGLIEVEEARKQEAAAHVREKDRADGEARERGRAVAAEKAAREALAKTQRLTAGMALDHALGQCEKGEVVVGVLEMARALNYAPDAADVNEPIRLSLSDWLRQAGRLNMVLSDTADAIAAFSADGRSVVTAGRHGHVKRWDPNTGKLLSQQQLKVTPGNRLVLSPDCRWLFNSPWNGLVGAGELFDLTTGEQVWTDAQRESVVDGAFHPDGKSILVADRKKETQFWDLATHKPIGAPLGPPVRGNVPGSVKVACSPDGKTVLFEDMRISFLDAPTGKSLGFVKNAQNVYAAAFSPDGRYLATSGGDTRIWEVSSAKLLRILPEGMRAAFSPDGRTILTGFRDRARLWDRATGALLVSRLQHAAGIRSVSFSHDGATLLTAGADNTARLWSAPPMHARPLANVVIQINNVAYHSNGKQLAGWWPGRPNGPAVWDVVNNKLIKTPQISPSAPLVKGVSQDGRTYLTTDGLDRLQLRDMSSDEPIGPPIPCHWALSRPELSPWGPALTVPTGERCQLWDAQTGNPLGKPIQYRGWFFCSAAASPDGRKIAVGDYGGVSLWDTTSGVMLAPAYRLETNVWRLTFSPDSRTILMAPSGMHGVFLDGATLKPIAAPFAIEKSEFPAAFNAKDHTVLIGHTDNLARLWDYTTGNPVGPPLRHRGKVLAVAFSPQGRMVVIGSDDNTARFWDPVLGKPLGRPLRHKGPVRDVAFSPDGNTVATACHESGPQLWPVPALLDGDPEQLRLYAEVITGVELDEHGLARALDAKTWQERRSQCKILRGE